MRRHENVLFGVFRGDLFELSVYPGKRFVRISPQRPIFVRLDGKEMIPVDHGVSSSDFRLGIRRVHPEKFFSELAIEKLRHAAHVFDAQPRRVGVVIAQGIKHRRFFEIQTPFQGFFEHRHVRVVFRGIIVVVLPPRFLREIPRKQSDVERTAVQFLRIVERPHQLIRILRLSLLLMDVAHGGKAQHDIRFVERTALFVFRAPAKRERSDGKDRRQRKGNTLRDRSFHLFSLFFAAAPPFSIGRAPPF